MSDRMDIVDGGETIVQACRELGVDYVVSSPGSEWGPLWEALTRQGLADVPGPQYLNCPHELLAVDIALGYTWVTGRMQVVALHAGVGLMQAAMGLYAATIAELPMLVMSGDSSSFGMEGPFDPGSQWYSNHNVAGGLPGIVRPLVKWAHRVTSPIALYESVLRAGEMARVMPVGPTYLDIPIETMLADTGCTRLRKPAPVPRLRPSSADIEAVADMLLRASRPLIVAGSAGRSEQAADALVSLAELLSVPVVEAFSSDSACFPKEHVLHQGFHADALLQESDLVMVVRSRAPWYRPNRGPVGAKVVVIDEAPLKLHMAYQELRADLYLCGDIAESLRLLVDAVRAAPRFLQAHDAILSRKARWAAAHADLHERLRRDAVRARAESGIHPIALATIIGEMMPANTMYVDETTVHLHSNREHLDYRGARSYIAMRSGLGQGLGVALGMKLARPDRPVACLIGDGAFMYNPVIQSLAFARGANMPILVVIYDNGGYRSMRASQLAFYADGLGARNNMFHGERLYRFDYEDLARPFEGFGARVTTLSELTSALERARAALLDGRIAVVSVDVRDAARSA